MWNTAAKNGPFFFFWMLLKTQYNFGDLWLDWLMLINVIN